MNETLKKYILKLRSPKLLVAAGIVGIALIFLSSLLSDTSSEKETKREGEFSVSEYKAELERDITNAVKDITGNRRVSVVVTLESSVRYAYADEREESAADKSESIGESSQTNLKESYIKVKTADGGEKALLVTEQMPEIRGVAVICEGGDNEIIAEKIKNTVTAALGITSKRVYICGRKQ